MFLEILDVLLDLAGGVIICSIKRFLDDGGKYKSVGCVCFLLKVWVLKVSFFCFDVRVIEFAEFKVCDDQDFAKVLLESEEVCFSIVFKIFPIFLERRLGGVHIFVL